MIKFNLNGKETFCTDDKLKRLIDVLKGNYDLIGVKDSNGDIEGGGCTFSYNGKISSYKRCFKQIM